jgi:hypothetical protein
VRPRPDELPIAIVRAGVCLAFNSDALHEVQTGDVIVSIAAEAPG